ncbi:MAG: nucleotidyltransferase domain-containing protein, partial [Victivallis sp.]
MKQYSDTELLALAEENQQKARRLVAATRIVELWREAGAEVNLVGSLRTGLLMTHRDVDFHVYTPHPSPLDGIGVMARLAGSGRLAKFRYGDSMDTEERCLEFHAWLRSDDGELWQFDMIHIEKGSHFDGHFERVADRIGELLTPETRLAVLRL